MGNLTAASHSAVKFTHYFLTRKNYLRRRFTNKKYNSFVAAAAHADVSFSANLLREDH
jgi:hypothetical protein